MEIIHVFTNTYDIIYKNIQGAIHLPKAWKCWWLSWERNSLSGFTELKLSWLKRKLWFFFFLAFLAPREGGQAVGGCRQRLMAVGPGGHRGAAHRESSSLWGAGMGTHTWHGGAHSQLSCSKLLQGEGLVQRNFYLLWASLPAVKVQWRIGPQVCSLCWLEGNFPNQHGPFSWCSQPWL